MEELTSRERGALRMARSAAVGVLRKRLRFLALVLEAYRKLYRNERSVAGIRGEMVQLFRLSQAWARSEYTSVPWRSILYAAAAVLYFVNPVDLIPDAIVGLGFVDDVAVVSAVVRAIRRDLVAFQQWEAGLAPQRPSRRLKAAA